MRAIINGWIVFSLLLIVPRQILAFHEQQAGSPASVDRRPAPVLEPVTSPNPAAEAVLKRRLPGVKIDYDSLIQSPVVIQAPDGFLTGPNASGRGIVTPAGPVLASREPHRALKVFLREHRALFGHGDEALDSAKIRRDYVTKHNQVRTVVWEQHLDDIPIFDATMISHVTQREELVSLSSRFMADPVLASASQYPNRAATVAAPRVSAREAVGHALKDLGEAASTEQILESGGAAEGASKLQRFTAPGCNGNPEASLVWLPVARGKLRLCWNVLLARHEGGDTYRLVVDATTGEVWVRRRMTVDLEPASYRVFTSDSPSPFSPGYPAPSTAQPPLVPRSLITLSALDTNASPNGWINDGDLETRGNNVDAHADRNADDRPDLPRPQATAGRVFDFPLDLTQAPSTYVNASIVQLFYWCNWMHDQLYSLGFTEDAGNFQNDNFGRGGLGGDAILADAQDGKGFNNANFTPSDDGRPPRIQMFLWNGPDPDRDGSLDAEIILHEYTHGLSSRLVGGGSGISAVQTRGLGEGWSDFYALSLLSEPTDDLSKSYPAGGYVSASLFSMDQNYYFGIRRYPYTVDMAKNPLTFKDIDPSQASPHTGIAVSPLDQPFDPSAANEVHNQGELWCVTLWEARALLIQKHGFAIGNRLTLQLVTDGMKLSPPNPNFLQARDAILSADRLNNQGSNLTELWTAFAKRGMGFKAQCPPSTTTFGVKEAYDLPDDLSVQPSEGIVARGPIGGPFAPDQVTFTLANTGTNTLPWSARSSVDWLTLSPSSGILEPGASAVKIEASLSPAANTLPIGIYKAVLTFTNQHSGIPQIHEFSLRVGQPDYLVGQRLGDANGLRYQSFTFTPDGSSSFYSVCREAATNYPTPTATGIPLSLGDDDSQLVNLTGNAEVRLFSRTFRRFYINSNGSISFDRSDTGRSPELADFFSQARIAGLHLDLDPYALGRISWQQLSNRVVVSYDKVVEYEGTALDSFQIELFFDGVIRITYLDIQSRSGLVGLSRGLGIPVGFEASDFGRYPSCHPSLSIFLPAEITEGAGLLPMQGSVTLAQIPEEDVIVQLVSSDTSELLVPASVRIPASHTNVLFDLQVPDDLELDGSQNITVTASSANFNDGSAKVLVHDTEVARIQLTLPESGKEGGAELIGKITLDRASDANVLVGLTASPAAEVACPSVVLIPAGQQFVDFPFAAVDDRRIDGTQVVRITAHVENWINGSAALSVEDNDPVWIAVRLPQSIYEAAGTVTNGGQVFISGSLPTNLVVNLTSSAPSQLNVATPLVILAGETNADFNLIAIDDAIVNATHSVRIDATAEGFQAAGSVVSVIDDESPLVPSEPFPQDTATNLMAKLQLRWADGQTELISNGGFESGSIEGWKLENDGSGSFVINDGELDLPGPAGKVLPYEGGYSAVTAVVGPGSHQLYQDISLPSQGEGITLSWVHKIENWSLFFDSLQRFRVEILDPLSDTNKVLAIAFTTSPGDTSLQEWQTNTFDLSSFRGQTVRVAFSQVNLSGFINTHLDNVSVRVGRSTQYSYDVYFGNHEDLGTADLAGTTTQRFWDLPLLAPQQTYFWRIVSRQLGETAGPLWRFTTQGADRFRWSGFSDQQISQKPFPVSLTATDPFGQTVSNYSGVVSISAADSPEGANPRTMEVQPTNSVELIHGLWSGELTVTGAGLNVQLVAKDGQGRKGVSNPFLLVVTNDIFARILASPEPVIIRTPLNFTVIVTNTGAGPARDVFLTNILSQPLGDPVVTLSQGSYTVTPSAILCELGTIPPASGVVVHVTVLPGEVGPISLTASLHRADPDGDLNNNSAMRVVNVKVPGVSIEDSTTVEGDGGGREVGFFVNLSAAAGLPVAVRYETVGLTALAGVDYATTSGELIFAPGETRRRLVVPVIGDKVFESDETFSVRLTSPSNATIERNAATGTILNDDPRPLAGLPFSETWESGIQAPYWVTTGMGNHRSLITGFPTPHAGVQALTLEGGAVPTRNEVTLGLNALGHTNLVLRFWARAVDESPDGPPPSPFHGSADFDGVAISSDGEAWYEVQSLRQLTSSYQEFSVSLDEVVAARGLSYNTNFLIRFNRYSSPADFTPGQITLDDIAVTSQRVGVQLLPAVLSVEGCLPPNGVVDPGETVTVLLPLVNVGGPSAKNVTAALLPSEGVLAPSGVQDYGALESGAPPVLRPFTFTAQGPCGTNLSLDIRLADGGLGLGVFHLTVPLGAQVEDSKSVLRTGRVVIPSFGNAIPYATTNSVSGVLGTVSHVSVTISNLAHAALADVDVLLVSPQGRKVILLSDVTSSAVTNLTLTFEDEGAAFPQSGSVVSGRYRPTNNSLGDVFPSPVPSGPYETSLSALIGSDPNGPWRLFVRDHVSADAGSIESGWRLDIQTVRAVCCQDPHAADLAVRMKASPSIAAVGGLISYTAVVENRGPAAAPDTQLRLPLPPSLELVSVAPSQGSNSNSAEGISCALGILPPGSNAVVVVMARAKGPGAYFVEALVKSDASDNDVSNNRDAATVIAEVATLRIDDREVTEGDSGLLTASVAVTLRPASSETITVAYATGSDTAISGVDFNGSSGILTFLPGQTNRSIAVPIRGDTIFEDTEYFFITLSNPTNAILDRSRATVVINDNEAFPTVNILNVSVREGNSGTTNIAFRINLTPASAFPVTVRYVTSDGSAVSPEDYQEADDTVTIPPNTTSRTILVQVNGDTVFEPNEVFALVLLEADGAFVDTTNWRGIGTIQNDDTRAPTFATLPFSESWESGEFAPYWTLTGSGLFNSHITPRSHSDDHGDRTMTMESFSGDARHEVTLGLDVRGWTNLVLRYYAEVFDSTGNGPPTFPFTTSASFDGVAVSTNGVVWYEIDSLRDAAGFEDEHEVDLTAALNRLHMDPKDTIRIRFNHFGSEQFLDWISIDDISVVGRPKGFGITQAELVAQTCEAENAVPDPDELVTYRIALANLGFSPTTNVVATLLSSDHVTPLTASQSYGALAPQGPAASQLFQFIAQGSCGEGVDLLFHLEDGTRDLGIVPLHINLGAVTRRTNVFASSERLTLPSALDATPYPATLLMQGLQGVIEKVTVTLTNASLPDADVLLVSPAGDAVMLLSGTGGNGGRSSINVTFDDNALRYAPLNGSLFSGTYLPTDNGFPHSLSPPAPRIPYSDSLSQFQGTDPNGTWKLFVSNNDFGLSGTIRGWILRITTAQYDCCDTARLTSHWEHGSLFLRWSASASRYQIESTEGLQDDIHWQPASEVPERRGNVLEIRVDLSKGQRYYRLNRER